MMTQVAQDPTPRIVSKTSQCYGRGWTLNFIDYPLSAFTKSPVLQFEMALYNNLEEKSLCRLSNLLLLSICGYLRMEQNFALLPPCDLRTYICCSTIVMKTCVLDSGIALIYAQIFIRIIHLIAKKRH